MAVHPFDMAADFCPHPAPLFLHAQSVSAEDLRNALQHLETDEFIKVGMRESRRRCTVLGCVAQGCTLSSCAVLTPVFPLHAVDWRQPS